MTAIALSQRRHRHASQPGFGGVVGRYLRVRSAVFGGVGLVLIVVIAVAAPLVAPYDPNAQGAQSLVGPSAHHWLGTDELGRDLGSRLIFGARASLLVGFGSAFVGGVIGVPIGLVAGYLGRWVDATAMRVIDLLLAIPAVLMALVIIAVLGPSLINLIVAIGVAAVPEFARLTRASTLSVRERDFVTASRGMGAPTADTMFRTVLPNVLAPLTVQWVITASLAIVVEAGLSLLGLGVPPPAPSWGGMLEEARSYLYQSPTFGVFPGLSLAVTVFCLDRVGAGLRSAVGVPQRTGTTAASTI